MTIIVKQQIIKVYTEAGVFIDVWRDAPLFGFDNNTQPPKYAVNNVTSQISITLPRAFDNFDEGGDRRGRGTITAGNIIQVWVFDNASLTAGRLVFQGYIDGYTPAIDDQDMETVQVLITPFDATLGDVKFIGTQGFGIAGLSSSYVDPVTMFNWPFGQLISATSATAVTGGTTAALTLSNVTNMAVGGVLYLQGTGADAAKVNGPLVIQSIVGSLVTFTTAIPTNSYTHTIIVAGIAPTTSATAVTGGSTAAITVASVLNLVQGQTIGIVGTGTDLGNVETATIQSIAGSLVTFTAPLINSYAVTIGVNPSISFSAISNHNYAFPLTLDPTNPTTSGGPFYQAQLHNQSFVDWFEATRTLAPTNWFWRVNPNKTVTFNQAATTPKHTFIIGKHINAPQYQKNYSNLKNDVYVVGTGVTARATGSDTSIYGVRTLVIVEPRIIDANTCTRYAEATLAQQDQVDYRSQLTIVDSRGDVSGYGYDIETINVGDTCRIEDPAYNLLATLWDEGSWDVDSWDFPPNATINQTVVIAALTYKFDTVDVELSVLQPSQDRFLIDLARQFEASQFN